jgi:hypothetical protein
MNPSRSVTSSNAAHWRLSTLTPGSDLRTGGRHASKLLLAFEPFVSTTDGRAGQAGILLFLRNTSLEFDN